MILDTNAVSAILSGDPAIAAVLEGDRRHHLPAIVLGEYRFGLSGSRWKRRIEPWLERLERESTILVVDEHTARSYAAVRRELGSKGRPLPENDVWIAALAVQHRLPVVTRDQHFDHVPGVRRVSW
ncbi:MAG: type II toxin-antitoxin system VapC family toxin [Planctomycetes bacterium]|nr:type II toxin-antitoxin system VapC family toxin [Planctomycetota bacterium]